MPTDKSNDKVRDMFSQIAPKYDRMNHLLSMNVDRYWRWKTVRKVKASGSAPILDVCTGTGDLAFAYRKKAKEASKVVGSDFCNEMLDIAREKQKKASIDEDKLTFVEADSQELPFEDNHFQIVSVAFGLRNVQDTMRGLQEMVRVCKPDGQIAILEFSTPRMQPIKGAYQWYFKNVLPRIGQALARNDSDAYNYLPDTVGEFPAYEDLTELMSQAGMKDAKFFPLNFGIATLYVGRK